MYPKLDKFSRSLKEKCRLITDIKKAVYELILNELSINEYQILIVNIYQIYCNKCNKHRKFRNLKISHIFNETLVLSIICAKYGSDNDTIFKKEESVKI